MSLYLKNKNDELQNIEKEQKEATKRKRKKAQKVTAGILSAVGVLCALAVVAGAAAYMPILSKAETGEPSAWDQYAPGLGECQFNQACGETDTLSDLKYLGYEPDMTSGNLIHKAAIETEEQLKAVLSGLSTTGRTSEEGETTEIIFILTKDLTLTDWIAEGSANTFSNAVFDGQGHTITCTYTDSFKNTERRIDSANAKGGKVLAYGLLFGKVSDATVRNFQVNVKDNKLVYIFFSDAGQPRAYIGLGGVSGVADNAVFSDIEISGTREVVNKNSYCIEKREYGVGGLIGIVQSGVTLTRCKDDSKISSYFESYSYDSGNDKLIWTTGGVVGQISGTGNTMHACWGNGAYTYSGDRISNGHLLECGTIVGDVQAGGAVTIVDCAGGDTLGMIAAVHKDAVDNMNVSNCYGKTPYTFEHYEIYSLDASIGHTAYRENLTSLLSDKKERINSTDWRYDADTDQHYLLHPTSDYWVNLESISIGEPVGDEHEIAITGKVTLLDSMNTKVAFPENAKVCLYVTTDGTDPKENAVPTETVEGKDQNAQNEIEITASAKYTDVSQSMTVRARVKVLFIDNTGETETETVWWGPIFEKKFEPGDLYIDEPTLQASIENQSYEDFQETTAYPLGTTKLQLQGNGITEYTMYYDFRERSGMVLGETDSDSTIYWQTMTQKNKYKDPFTLTEDMVKNTSSNIVYMYVLAHIKKDNVDYYKLYEYDIVVFAKDKLISVTPDSRSKVPNGSTVTFKVGNGIEGEYPYDKMNMLISEEQKQYRTLEGQSGVVTYAGDDYKKESDGGTNLWYLTVGTKLSGTPGQTLYVYVEPCVNETGNYTRRYGKFVLEYSYTIMDKATGLELSPSTITMAQSGMPTGIPIKEKVYMNSGGNSDIIVYQMTNKAIASEIVESDATLQQIETKTWTTVGENAYCWGNDKKELYIRCNGQWYSIRNTDGKLCVYEDGNLFFDASHAGSTVYLSTILFSAGYDPSENWIYKYKVNEQDAVAAPTALLADGSSISMNADLYFNCEQNCVMYYTTDGKEPQITVASDNTISAETGTYRYNSANGIHVSTDNGFAYGTAVTIKIKAYPVRDTTVDTLVYNRDKKSSDIAVFNYTVKEQNQVETPKAYPETNAGNTTVVVNGDRISLSCGTSGATIYYTVNGMTPLVEESYKYPGVITVSGDYGGYFTVKAIAHKEGMRDSEVATYLYKIAEKDVVNGVTAIPSTTNQVIAGDKIILSTTESGADIYYTTDGTTPDVTENVDENGNISFTAVVGKKYDSSESITVPEGSGYFVIQAIAVKADMTNSPVAQFIYSYAESVGVPYGNPSSGTVTENTQVILRCAQEEAIIYYEIAYDGNTPAEPTTSSAVFSGQAPIIITRDTKIKAFAFYNRESSPVVTLDYKLAQKMGTPSASVSSGAIVPSGTAVNLSSDGGKVYYTTDGSDPSDSTNTAVNIGSSIVITGKAGDKVNIKACTKQSGSTTSEMATFTYQISQYPGGVSTDTETGSTLSGGSSIHLMTDVTGGTIYYSTGSDSPITAGTAGNSVVLSGEPGSNITVKAVAIAPNTTMTGSYASFSYKLMEQLAAPHASVKDGTVLTEKTGIVLKANKGKIYFTIDGTDPTKASNEYTAPIVVSKAMTIKAVAVEEGSENSEISSFSYSFAEQVNDVKSSVPAGTVQAGEVVKLSCATKDAKIYYTTDGTDPSPDAEEGVFVYDDREGISIHRSVSVKAVAIKDDMCDSEVICLNYKVEEVPVVIEKEKAAAKEAEEGLKPLDVSNLGDRRVQPLEKTAGSDVALSDFLSKVTIRGNMSLVPSQATFQGKEISVSDDVKTEVRKLFGDDYELVSNYSCALYNGGERIYPKGQFEIGIPVPEEYENADVTIVSINENGGVEVCDGRREDGYIFAEVSHLNNFALAVAPIVEKRHAGVDLVPIVSGVAGGLVLAGIGMITITVKKRKRY